jgi:hypothetical protein
MQRTIEIGNLYVINDSWFFISQTGTMKKFKDLTMFRIMIELAQLGWEPTFADDDGSYYFKKVTMT